MADDESGKSMYDQLLKGLKDPAQLDLSFVPLPPAAEVVNAMKNVNALENEVVDGEKLRNEEQALKNKEQALKNEEQSLKNEKLKKESTSEIEDESTPNDPSAIEKVTSEDESQSSESEKASDESKSSESEKASDESQSSESEKASDESKSTPSEPSAIEKATPIEDVDKKIGGNRDQTGGVFFTKEECSFF